MSTVAVRYVGPQPERYLPDLGVTVDRGAVIDVPAALAGREPGPWREPGPLESDRPPVDGWPRMRSEDGPDGPVWLVRDPGAGLLAQVDVWQRADSAFGGEIPPALPGAELVQISPPTFSTAAKPGPSNDTARRAQEG